MDYKRQLNFNYEALGMKPYVSSQQQKQIETPTYGSLRQQAALPFLSSGNVHRSSYN